MDPHDYKRVSDPVMWSPDSSKILFYVELDQAEFHRQYPGVTVALTVDVETGDAEGVEQFWLNSDTRPMWDPTSPHEVVRTPGWKYDLLKSRDRAGNIGDPGSRFVLATDHLWLRLPDSNVAVLLERMSQGHGIRVAPSLDMAVMGTQYRFSLVTAGDMDIRVLLAPEDRATMTLDIERLWWTHDSQSVVFVTHDHQESQDRQDRYREKLWRISIGAGESQ